MSSGSGAERSIGPSPGVGRIALGMRAEAARDALWRSSTSTRTSLRPAGTSTNSPIHGKSGLPAANSPEAPRYSITVSPLPAVREKRSAGNVNSRSRSVVARLDAAPSTIIEQATARGRHLMLGLFRSGFFGQED